MWQKEAGKEAPREFANLAPASPATWQGVPPGVCQPRKTLPAGSGKLRRTYFASLPALPGTRFPGKPHRAHFASLPALPGTRFPGKFHWAHLASLPALPGPASLANSAEFILPVCRPCCAGTPVGQFADFAGQGQSVSSARRIRVSGVCGITSISLC